MTKDRARKRAARSRAAITGERYVVARRQAEEPPTRTGGLVHELTHRMPGVPSHAEGGLQARRPRGRGANSALQNRPGRGQPRVRGAGAVHQNRPHHDQPRVLIGWQNRIARLFGAK